MPRPVATQIPQITQNRMTIVTSAQPNIYDLEQLEEFAAAPDLPDLTPDDLERVAALYARNFDLQPAGV